MSFEDKFRKWCSERGGVTDKFAGDLTCSLPTPIKDEDIVGFVNFVKENAEGAAAWHLLCINHYKIYARSGFTAENICLSVEDESIEGWVSVEYYTERDVDISFSVIEGKTIKEKEKIDRRTIPLKIFTGLVKDYKTNRWRGVASTLTSTITIPASKPEFLVETLRKLKGKAEEKANEIIREPEVYGSIMVSIK